jgi:transcription antitermination factor NusG
MAAELLAGSGDGGMGAAAAVSTVAVVGSLCAGQDGVILDPAEVADPLRAAGVADPLRVADAAGGERWAVLYTYSRREKRVARACDYLGVRYYLPLHESHTGTVRRRMSRVPLFPGYVFACVDSQTRTEILQTGAVVRVIRVLHPDALLLELRQIRAALDASVDLIPGIALERGDRVRVVCGPMVGVEGLVVRRRRRRKRERLILNVSILGQSVGTEVDLCDVERVRSVRDGRPGEQRQVERIAC